MAAEQPKSPRVSVRFDGLEWETSLLKEYNIDSAYMTSTDAFSFCVYEPDIDKLRDLELQPVSIYIDGNLQFRGRVEQSEIGRDHLAIRLQGRDYLADLVECHVDPALALSTNMTIEQAVKLAAAPIGVTKVSFDPAPWRNARLGSAVSSPLETPAFATAKLKEYKPNPGEGIFQLLSRLCVRLGCTVQPTMERDTVLIGAPDYVQESAYSVSRSRNNPQSAQNNVINAVARRDYSKFPTVVLVTGQASKTSAKTRKAVAASSDSGPSNPGVLSANARAAATTSGGPPQKLAATDVANIRETILALLPDKYIDAPNAGIWTHRITPTSPFKGLSSVLYRLLYIRDELGKDTDQVANTAARAAAERLKDCLQYEVTFRGHSDPVTGRTFAPDTIIDVSDEICGVFERMWVERVTFSYQPGAGATTTIVCWRPGSFGIGANQ